MISRFEEVLGWAEPFFSLPLRLDKHGACSVQLTPELMVQMQTDASGSNVLIACRLGQLNPGRWREDVLKEALIANHKDVSGGILSYVAKTSQLMLFHCYPLDLMDRSTTNSLLASLTKTAQKWQEALASGHTHPANL